MSGFDDIINNLDNWANRKEEPLPKASVRPPAPTFRVGDIVVIRETSWPPNTNKINKRTGLYSEPGYPQLGDLAHAQQSDEVWEFNADLHARLQDHLVGTVKIGDLCKVAAVWCHDDGKTYYFIDNGQAKGWTRCGYRFRHASENELRRR